MKKGVVTTSVGTIKIPRLTQAYIDLQFWCSLGIPQIHDAWQQGDMQVILIQDRSNWQYLFDVCCEKTMTLLDILNSMYHMTELWTVLERVNCRQSLLELSNLRLDEDQSLALQQLYMESVHMETQPLTIQNLGLVWGNLFAARTITTSIQDLLVDLQIGKIQSLLQLQSRLKAIGSELEYFRW